MGMVVVPILSYLVAGWMIGWASAPYNPAWAFANPRRAGLMAIAGPAANFILVLLAGLLIRSGIEMHFFQAPPSLGLIHMTEAVNDGWPDFAAKTVSILFSLNLLLGAFNLIPIPPLDGASIPLLFSNQRMAQALFGLIRHPTLRIVGMYLAWKLFGQIFRPLLLMAGHLLYPGIFFQ
jgi:Zn-dependent protease